MERRLMEFIIKEADEENETMHFRMYGSFSTQRSVYDGIDEPEFYDVAVKKIVDGKETDFESKVVTFSGHKLTNIDCAEQTFASIVCLKGQTLIQNKPSISEGYFSGLRAMGAL